MRQSKLFTKIERSDPRDEAATSAKFLARAGFVYKNSAGIYSFLPLGWRVIQRIAGIIRKEINAIGGQELFLPALVEKKYLEATGRWNMNIGYKLQATSSRSATGQAGDERQATSNFVLGWTHEEVIAEIATKYISSYKDLPVALYQIQTKFRNEPRAKSGLLRSKEFLMKDLYSFHASEKDFSAYYKKVAGAYRKIFLRCGLKAIYALAAGGDFTTENTHEFQIISDVGEDAILVCEKCGCAENKEISTLKNGSKCAKCGGKISEKKSIEVGNIFPLGDKYSRALNLEFSDEKGEKHYVIMGSYGIGLGRLMAAAVEVHHDAAGIIWPEEISPFKAHLLALNGASGENAYESLQKAGVDVLYDERELSAGEKFAEADLLGITWRLVVSPKTDEMVEIKKRGEKDARVVSLEKALTLFAS